MAKIDIFKTRLDNILQLGDIVSQPIRRDSFTNAYYDDRKFFEFRSAALSLLGSLYGTKHSYYVEFSNRCEAVRTDNLNAGLGILRSVKNELDNGWLETIKGLISAEVFSNFLEMAEHLLEQGYKDPAAVMTGSVLEEHLRQLCQKNGIDVYTIKDGKQIPKKADLLNAELTKGSIYNAIDQKQVTAWLDLRNKAAHGKYSEYAKEQVELMYQGVLSFMSRIS